MQRQISRKPRRATVAALLPALALMLACGGDGARAQHGSAGSRGNLQTQPLESDPCAWVTAAEVERVVGPLEGSPRRGKTAENPSPQEDGRACVYTLAGTGSNEGVAIQVDLSDATSYEAGYAMGASLVAQDPAYQAFVAAEGEVEKPSTPEGWDYFGEGALGAVFRVGHMAVIVHFYTPRSLTGKEQTTKAVELATLIRDRVPDLPVAAEYGDPNAEGRGPDPCALLTRGEAEAVMGKLKLPPYRSKQSTPFADGSGRGCSYYRGKHRVLVLTPTWSDGREMFGLGSGLTDEITTKTGLGEQSADTLEGPWDQAKGDIDGTLNFLTGDRLLEVKYRTAGIDQAGALRLATIAANRLKAAP